MMIWHYHCPECGQELQVAWDDLTVEVNCPRCHNDHYPATPSEDNDAYVGTDHWPKELEDTVLALRGTTCSVPGCFHEFDTLVHRLPPTMGGRTSVANLLPLCARHARMKGHQEYSAWLATLPKEETQPPGQSFEITFTHKKKPEARPAPAQPVAAPGLNARFIHHLAGKGYVPDGNPSGMHLVATAPFLPGPIRRLLFHYDWKLEHKGSARVILTAWPHNSAPDLGKGADALPKSKVENRHEGKAGDQGNGRLELPLTSFGDEIWTAAVLLQSEGGRPELTDYLLAGID